MAPVLRRSRRHDLIVVGGGAAGLIASREARRRGAHVLLVQDGPPGGDCTFTGCIPSKTLLAAAAGGAGFDDAIERVHRTVARIAASEDPPTLRAEGIEVIDGRARFRSPNAVEVAGADGSTHHLRSERVVIATGAAPAIPDVPGLHGAEPLTSETVFTRTRRPASLLVLGGGPMGCEMAQAFARFGTRVTLVETADRLLPREDPTTSSVIAGVLTDDGVEVLTGSTVTGVRRHDGRVAVELERGSAGTGDEHTVELERGADGTHTRRTVEHRQVDEVLVAAGRTPSTEGLGLAEIGVALDERGAIVVDAGMRTSVRGIFAAGDVTGLLQLTHAAGRMGWIATSNALWAPARVRGFRFDPAVVPYAVFTSPEVGRVGLTESEAAKRHPGARVAHLPLAHVDRAIAAGSEQGFVQLIAAPRRGVGHLAGGRLVGATIVAPTGGDLVHEVALAMQTRMFTGRLAQTTHAYPTWAAALQQTALQFFGTSAGHRARPARRG